MKNRDLQNAHATRGKALYLASPLIVADTALPSVWFLWLLGMNPQVGCRRYSAPLLENSAVLCVRPIGHIHAQWQSCLPCLRSGVSALLYWHAPFYRDWKQPHLVGWLLDTVVIVHNNHYHLSYKSYTLGKLIHKLLVPITNLNYCRKILLFLDHLLGSLFLLGIYFYCYATNFDISFLW